MRHRSGERETLRMGFAAQTSLQLAGAALPDFQATPLLQCIVVARSNTHRLAGSRERRRRKSAVTDVQSETRLRLTQPDWVLMSKPRRPIGIHGSRGDAPREDRSRLLHRFQRLMLDGLRSQAANVRRGDDLGVGGELGCRLLIGRTPDIERATCDQVFVERSFQCRVVDQFPARRIDEKRAVLHLRETGSIHQVLGLGRCGCKTDDEIGVGQKTRQISLSNALIGHGCPGIAYDDPHAEGERQVTKVTAYVAVTDHTQRRVPELSAHRRH